MFEVGFTEILLILGIALLVLGPERLPKLAADMGRWTGRARAMARQLKTQLEQEANYDPLREERRPSPTIHTPAAKPSAPSGQAPAQSMKLPPGGSAAPTEPVVTAEPAVPTEPALAAADGSEPTSSLASPAAPPAAAPDRSDEPQPS